MRQLTIGECSRIYGGGSQPGQSLVTCESVVGTLATGALNVALGVGVAVSGGGIGAGAAARFLGDVTGIPGALGSSFAGWACSPSGPDMSFQNSVGGFDVGSSGGLNLDDLFEVGHC